MMRNRQYHLWDVVTTLVLVFEAVSCSNFGHAEDYSPQFLTYVDQVILDLVQNAFWTEGQWHNMTLRPEKLFSLLYDKPPAKASDPTTDPTGVYAKPKRHKRELPFIYQSAPPPVPCNNAASTSIISGAKAVDFAAFAIGQFSSLARLRARLATNVQFVHRGIARSTTPY